MSATMTPPIMQPAGPPGLPLGGPPGMPPPGGGAPPGMMPNPAFAAWQQQMQQVQGVIAENTRRQGEFDAAIELIRKDGLHGFRLDIEADSTVAPDEQAEKQARIEFMQQFIPLLETVVPVAQGNPALASLAKEATLFAVRGFQVARTLEEAIEKAFDQIAQMPPHPSQTPPQKGGTQQNPAIEAAKIGADVKDTAVKAQTDMAAIAQKQEAAVLAAQVAAKKVDAEQQRSQADLMLQAAEMQMRERLEQGRLAHMASRDAGTLT